VALNFLIDNNFFRIKSSFFTGLFTFYFDNTKKIFVKFTTFNLKSRLILSTLNDKKNTFFTFSIKLLLRDYEHRSTLNYFFFNFVFFPSFSIEIKTCFLSLMRIRFCNIKGVLLLIYAFDHCTLRCCLSSSARALFCTRNVPFATKYT